MIDYLLAEGRWSYLLAVLILVWICVTIRSAWQNRKLWKKRNSDRKLETVLQPGETVKHICPQKKGRCILTSKRLLWETGEGFTAVALKSVKRVQGITKEGKTTSSVPKMVRMTVKAEDERTIFNTCEEFAPLARALQDKIRKQNQKKKK